MLGNVTIADVGTLEIRFTYNETTTKRIWQAPGVRVEALRIPQPERQDGHRPPFATSQLQGAGFAAGEHWSWGRECARALLGIENLGQGATVGRVDLACDLWLPDDADGSAARWLRADGSSTLARERWGGRWQKSQAIDAVVRSVGTAGETTLYLGARAGCQLRIYRKDVDFRGNTAEKYHAAWKANGWIEGQGSVVRLEFEIHRRWLSKQRIDEDEVTADGECRHGGAFLDILPADELWPLLPAIWRRLTGNCYPADLWTRTREDSARSGPWDIVRNATWEDGGAAGIRREDRAADVTRALRNLRSAAWRAEKICGGQDQATEYFRLAHGEQYEEEKAAWRRRSRWAISDCAHSIDSPIDDWLDSLASQTAPEVTRRIERDEFERREFAGLPGYERSDRARQAAHREAAKALTAGADTVKKKT